MSSCRLFISVLLFLTISINALSDTLLDDWHLRDSHGTNAGAIVYGDGLFVTVGLNGAVLTSSDGIYWTARISGTADNFSHVCFGNGIFLAAGFANGGWFTRRSTNGVNWTAPSWPPEDRIHALGFAQGEFVAMGWGIGPRASAQLSVSTNGVNWVHKSLSVSGAKPRDWTFGKGLFVAVGEIYDPFDVDPRLGVMTSSNLVDWTGLEFYFNPYEIFGSVAFGNGIFVAVGEAQVVYPPGVVASSSNGFTWTIQRTNLAGLSSVAFGKGVFVAVQSDGVITTSPDGVNWTLRSTISPVLTGVEFGADTFVAVGGTNILQSDPLITMSAGPNGQLAIDGPLGRICRIEYVNDLQPTNVWQTATNLTLVTKPTFWTDPTSGTESRRFFRTVLDPIP
jgi:hypothetical protein